MVGPIPGTNRHEEVRCPARLDDSISAEHPVRVLAPFVEELDLAPRGCQRLNAAATGRPASHPGDLLQLSMYGDLSRLRSSRRLEQETPRHVARRWLWKTRRPDHQTLATCRRANLQPRRRVCRACTLLCTQLDLFSGERVASDGSTCTAVNAPERHCTRGTLQRLLPQLEARLATYLKELARGATEDDHGTPGGARAAQRQATRAGLPQSKRLEQACQEQRLASGQDQRSLPAPASRAMQRGTGGGTEVG